ncbi:MAG: hypothetical protein JWP97_6831 [Labilithrix sp.]|nr:hypothetical protein [Labilithrix sp.]
MKLSIVFANGVMGAALLALSVVACTTTVTREPAGSGEQPVDEDRDAASGPADSVGHSPRSSDGCTTLATPSAVEQSFLAGPAADPRGGYLAYGTYVLESADVYGTHHPEPGPVVLAFSFDGTRFERISSAGGMAGTYQLGDTTLTMVPDCFCRPGPEGSPECDVRAPAEIVYSFSVSATSNELELQTPYPQSGTAVFTLRRR